MNFVELLVTGTVRSENGSPAQFERHGQRSVEGRTTTPVGRGSSMDAPPSAVMIILSRPLESQPLKATAGKSARKKQQARMTTFVFHVSALVAV